MSLPPVIIAAFQTGSQANGGIESLSQIVAGLPGPRPTIVTQIETAANGRWRAAGARVLVWPIPYRMGAAWRAGGAAAAARRAASLVASNARMARLAGALGRPLLHCNDILALWHTAPGARAAGARVLHNIRDVKPDDEPYGRQWAVAARLSHTVVALSAEMERALVRRVPGLAALVAAGRVELESVYSAVDLAAMRPAPPEERAALRRRLGIPPEEFAIGYVAGFSPKKAQLAFIEGAGPLLADMAGAAIYFLGDTGPEQAAYGAACRAAAGRLGDGRLCRFPGFAGQIADWYRALDLVVLASRNEGLARCMIESLACGTPVVSFDVCSAHEILSGHACGVVVPQGDYGALAAAVRRLRDRGGERAALGARGALAAARLFDPRLAPERYLAIYRRMAGHRHSYEQPGAPTY